MKHEGYGVFACGQPAGTWPVSLKNAREQAKRYSAGRWINELFVVYRDIEIRAVYSGELVPNVDAAPVTIAEATSA